MLIANHTKIATAKITQECSECFECIEFRGELCLLMFTLLSNIFLLCKVKWYTVDKVNFPVSAITYTFIWICHIFTKWDEKDAVWCFHYSRWLDPSSGWSQVEHWCACVVIKCSTISQVKYVSVVYNAVGTHGIYVIGCTWQTIQGIIGMCRFVHQLYMEWKPHPLGSNQPCACWVLKHTPYKW